MDSNREWEGLDTIDAANQRMTIALVPTVYQRDERDHVSVPTHPDDAFGSRMPATTEKRIPSLGGLSGVSKIVSTAS